MKIWFQLLYVAVQCALRSHQPDYSCHMLLSPPQTNPTPLAQRCQQKKFAHCFNADWTFKVTLTFLVSSIKIKTEKIVILRCLFFFFGSSHAAQLVYYCSEYLDAPWIELSLVLLLSPPAANPKQHVISISALKRDLICRKIG